MPADACKVAAPAAVGGTGGSARWHPGSTRSHPAGTARARTFSASSAVVQLGVVGRVRSFHHTLPIQFERKGVICEKATEQSRLLAKHTHVETHFIYGSFCKEDARAAAVEWCL